MIQEFFAHFRIGDDGQGVETTLSRRATDFGVTPQLGYLLGQGEPGANTSPLTGPTSNWLKMYDKFGQILRVEVGINRPYMFRAFKA